MVEFDITISIDLIILEYKIIPNIQKYGISNIINF